MSLERKPWRKEEPQAGIAEPPHQMSSDPGCSIYTLPLVATASWWDYPLSPQPDEMPCCLRHHEVLGDGEGLSPGALGDSVERYFPMQPDPLS